MRVASDVQAAELAILNAPFEENGWHRATLMVARATRSSAAQLIGIGGPKVIALNVVAGEIVGPTAHLSDPILYGPCNWRLNSVGAPMSIQHEGHYRAYAAATDTAVYDDAVSDVDLPFGCQSMLLTEPERAIGLSLLRRGRDGRCDAEVLTRFAYLRAHVARAIRMQLALDGEAARLMLGHLETIDCATLLLDRHAILAEMTPAAEPLFDLEGPLRLAGLAVQLAHPGLNRDFQRLLGRLLREDGPCPDVMEMRVANRFGTGGAGWRLIASRLPAREHGLGFEPSIAITVRPLPGPGQ